MKNLVMVVALMLGLIAPAFADDTSVTVVRRVTPTPSGVSPLTSYVNALVNAAAASAQRLTVDLLDSTKNVPAAKLEGCIPHAENVSGTEKLYTFVRSGRTMTVTPGLGTSNTMVISDTVRIHCDLKP